MRIQKDNIVIRSATVDDAIQLNKWWNDGRIMEHAGFPNGLGESLENTIENIKSREGKLSQLCIIEIDGEPVGELSYGIADDNTAYPGWKICDFNYQNKGYGPKIIMMLFEFLFTDETINSKCSTDKIAWDTMLENKRAQYVYENKIGARKTGVRENAWKDQTGKWRTAVYYELNREEFYNR
ncbi:MAG TPA: GNAT family protein [Tissierellaceae bacterium]